MYDVRPNLIIGFHGCDKATRDALVTNPDTVKISQEPFDWLGHGMYFWENNYERALDWAEAKRQRGKIKDPAVVGATINLGLCFDMLDSKYIKMLPPYYNLMEADYSKSNKTLPKNVDAPKDAYKDKVLRELDCSVIEYMHSEIYSDIQIDTQKRGFTDIKLFDSVRGVFTEGGPAFEGAGILEKTHIQICIRNLNCIKGFFIPRQEKDYMEWHRDNYQQAI
ncbi:hypothetical protein SAMN05428988_5596 [Chitinophaga sp. YR573]|uniref:hypothetical protein n=1 Tax=Chitinophaga sp. YR573 TaxID=1881040 RepID=UPI0008CD3CB0|nr:hypothetical protein [Chitinophaga sp. YR573]SEW43638.1 hypothetical protein SAMN05428988_5596 [Chitinophaga sp. YR573]